MTGFARILGIMSGTSLDGVDYVLARFHDDRPDLVRHWARPFSPKFRERLLACASGESDSWETARLHHDLGRLFAGAAQKGLAGSKIDAVGLHGQTVFHDSRAPAPATLQLGEPAYLAQALRVPVVSNFRAGDLAAGGQGAPLATLFHVRTFAVPGQHVCVQNLGGIANVTSIDWTRGIRPIVLAFDIGPCNLLLDGAMRLLTGGRTTLDRGGRLAERGQVDHQRIRGWMRLPFFRKQPPRSTGREQFGRAYLDRLWFDLDRHRSAPPDRLATLTEFAAQSIALNYQWHLPKPPDLVVLGGGGANNASLVRRLSSALREWVSTIEIKSSGDLGWPVATIEGAAFALLARERLLGRPGTLLGTTGARRPVLCGQISGHLG